MPNHPKLMTLPTCIETHAQIHVQDTDTNVSASRMPKKRRKSKHWGIACMLQFFQIWI